MAAEKIKYFCNGEFKESKTDVWYDLHNPSTGEVTGYAPCCTNDEVLEAVEAAKEYLKNDCRWYIDDNVDKSILLSRMISK